jgi:hypothetical protein
MPELFLEHARCAAADVAQQLLERIGVQRGLREVPIVLWFEMERPVGIGLKQHGKNTLAFAPSPQLLGSANLGNVGAVCQKRQRDIAAIDRLLDVRGPDGPAGNLGNVEPYIESLPPGPAAGAVRFRRRPCGRRR